MILFPRQKLWNRLSGQVSTSWGSVQALLNEIDTFTISTTFTPLLLLLYSGNNWFLRVPISLLCIAAVLFRPLLTNSNFWFVVTLVLFAGNYYDWYTIDNHKYLMTYWSLAIYCALLTKDHNKTLAFNARLLIGLSFLFAVIWKVMANQYFDGSFFHFTLLSDQRFKDVARFWGGISGEMSLYNQRVLLLLSDYESTLQHVQLRSSPQLQLTSMVLSWWTLGIETLIAAAFLWPKDRGLSKARDILLIIFLFTTYAVATVVGFGWLLVTMGLTQTSNRSRYLPLYVVTFFLIQLYLTPLADIVRGAFGVPFPF